MNNWQEIQHHAGFTEYQLSANGLTVLLYPDTSMPVVTVMITYLVGSRYEQKGLTGATHLLEHMMFKGSKKFNKENRNDIWTVLQSVGAKINATTWLDRTNYYETLPVEHLDLALEIEADRMRGALLKKSDFDAEKIVVLNEFDRSQNNAYHVLNERVWETAFDSHPYKYATIGLKEDIETATIEKLSAFYNTYYWPNNAVLTVIGDLPTDILGNIHRFFGSIPKSPNPIPKPNTEEPVQKKQKYVRVQKAGTKNIIKLAYKAVPALHPDYAALTVLGAILTVGKSSRCYQQFVDTGLATHVTYSFHGHVDAGLFSIVATICKPQAHEAIKEALLAVVQDIQQDGVSDDECEKIKAKLKKQLSFSKDGSYSIASYLNEAIALGNWTFYTRYLTMIEAVVPADIQHVAKTYLQTQSLTVGIYESSKQALNVSAQEPVDHQVSPMTMPSPESGSHISKQEKTVKVSKPATMQLSSLIRKSSPIEGVSLYTLKTQTPDIIRCRLSFPAGSVYEDECAPYIAMMVAEMCEESTQTMHKDGLNKKLDALGATAYIDANSHFVSIHLTVLKEHIKETLQLVSQMWIEPQFDEHEFKMLKELWMSNIEHTKETNMTQASIALSQHLYPKKSPNYAYSSEKQQEIISDLNLADVVNFHQQIYGRGSINVVCVGDVEHENIADYLASVFGEWGLVSPKPRAYPQANQVQSAQQQVHMPDKKSNHVLWGYPITISRGHTDFHAMSMANFIFGGNFASRLMMHVRDRCGLTYGISSGIAGHNFGKDGYWYVLGSFSNAQLEQGIKETENCIKQWIESGVTETELAQNKQTMIGNYKVGLATTAGLTSQIARILDHQKPLVYLDTFPERIATLTRAYVNKVLKQYINPKELVRIEAGTFPT